MVGVTDLSVRMEMMSPGSTPGKKEGLMNRTASEKVEEWKEMGFSPKSCAVEGIPSSMGDSA